MSDNIVYAKVMIRVKEGTDPYEAVNEADYSFDHSDILETEIVDISDTE